ncbi:MAG: crossover junction endodeoxyribonuclease RuvC [Lacisediminihabitans sp.]
MRVMGIDPGLTRCGVGIVDVTATRTATLVEVAVIRTPPELPIEQRLLIVGRSIDRYLDEYAPDALAIERVFAQHNLRTVMGTAQVSGVALHAAARRGLPVGLHTPSEVKAAITGYGAADKTQVATMVARVLGLAELPRPADAADSLAIALCHAWRSPTDTFSRGMAPSRDRVAGSGGAGAAELTPAQQAWLAAERSTAKSGAKRRLAP